MPWITFTDGSGGYCDGEPFGTSCETAERITGKTAVKSDVIPYPANPIIYQSGPNPCPPFCYTPMVCKGRLSCPKNIACSE